MLSRDIYKQNKRKTNERTDRQTKLRNLQDLVYVQTNKIKNKENYEVQRTNERAERTERNGTERTNEQTNKQTEL